MIKNTIIGLLTGYIVSSLDIWEFNLIQRILTIYVICITVMAVICWLEDIVKERRIT